tara:strand:- start:788 stop:1699 length:912 start_codon:yes stop_codon:yes gene_type:complete
MKLSKFKLRKIIEAALLNEGRMSKSERELIRLQVEIELGEEFELLAAQAKDLEDYNRMNAIFQQQVREETQKRITAREAGMADPPIQSLKVKINSLKNRPRYADPGSKKAFEDQFQQTANQEIVPVSPRQRSMASLPGPTDHPNIEMTPGEDDGNTIDVTNMSLSRRDLLKGMMAGTAAAGIAGAFDPFVSTSESAVDELLKVANDHLSDVPQIAEHFKLKYDGLDPIMEWDFVSITGDTALKYVIRKDGSKYIIEQSFRMSRGSEYKLVKKEVLKKGIDGASNIKEFVQDLYFWLRGKPLPN